MTEVTGMSMLSVEERAFLETLSRLCYANPFLPERIELERAALGVEFDERSAVWSKLSDWEQERPNVARINARAEQMAESLRERLVGGEVADARDLQLYDDLIAYVLYHRYRETEARYAVAGADGDARSWQPFLHDVRHYLSLATYESDAARDPAHLFACYSQLRRAFLQIFHHIVGSSMPAARLRAAVWQSIFTHDMRRYRRSLYERIGDFTTLIIGPSGTGKELVARAIGLSRYVPFDATKRRFREDVTKSFFPLNLSALSPTLIESELFGHCRGAFTGAVDDRAGWLELCPPLGSVFLDEIGDLDAAIQVKLLRILQTRTFQRLGETKDRQFHGKIIAATNRDLAAGTADGSFREDFYYRICSDVINTPSLHDQLRDCPADLTNLVATCVQRVAGQADDELIEEVVGWIDEHLGHDYVWSGNFRELEQCVRNLIVRRSYRPPRSHADSDARRQLADAMLRGDFTADELLSRYCTLMYAECGSYEQAARRLKLDRRTVKSKIQPDLLERLQ